VGWPNRDLANYFANYAGILAKHLGDRIKVWAPFNMPWAIAFMGYAAGAFPPCRTSFSDFLKAAHILALAQAEAHRAVKAASSQATVGSAMKWLQHTRRLTQTIIAQPQLAIMP
jgi:beta-glucosidase